MQRKSLLILIISVLILAFGASVIARAQETAPTEALAPVGPNVPTGTSFTYQGQLKGASGPVTDSCDFQLGLWDALASGTQVGSTLTLTGVAVSEGLFTVQLDFGTNAFDGSARWLEIAVRCPAGSGAYSTLSPRQPLTPAPYALYSANADTLDGQHANELQRHYQNLVVVAKSGGDFTTITDALNSITTNSADNPFTIYVAPGVYVEKITMKPYVDIEGAGEQATKITYTGSVYASSGTVNGTSNAELRFLTVENTGENTCAVALYTLHTSLNMTNLTVIATGGTEYNFGVYSGYLSPVMMNMSITASGTAANNIGVYITNGSPRMENVYVTASGGNYVYGIENTSSASTMMTNVTAYASGGTIYNTGVYNNYAGTPIMTNVTATGSGGTYAYGVQNYESSPTMNQVTATASGGEYTYGVHNSGIASPVMNNVIATASEGDMNYGVYNSGFSCTPTLSYVTATAWGGTESHGIYNNYTPITMTNVIASGSDATNQDSGVFNIGAEARMTNVTASASNGAEDNFGVYNDGESQPMMNVTASASGGNNSYGVYNLTSSPEMTNVKATASGATNTYGIFSTSSSPVMNNLNATASGGTNNYGVWNNFSSVTIQNSVISASGGTSDGIHNNATSGSYTVKINNSQVTAGTSTIYQVSYYTTRVGASLIAGGGAFGGTYLCVASYNGNYVALDSTCH